MSKEVNNITSNDFEEAKKLIFSATTPAPVILKDENGFFYNEETGIICDEKGIPLFGESAFRLFLENFKHVSIAECNHKNTESRKDLSANICLLAENNLPLVLEFPEKILLEALKIKNISEYEKLSLEELLEKRTAAVSIFQKYTLNGTEEEKSSQATTVFEQLLEAKKYGVRIQFSNDAEILLKRPDMDILRTIFPNHTEQQEWIYENLELSIEAQKRENLIHLTESGAVTFYGISHYNKDIDIDDKKIVRKSKSSVLIAATSNTEDLVEAYRFAEASKMVYQDHMIQLKQRYPDYNSLVNSYKIEYPDYVYDAVNNVFIKAEMNNGKSINDMLRNTTSNVDADYEKAKKENKYSPLR